MNMLNNAGLAIVAGAAGGWLAAQHIITVGTIVVFINYTRQFTPSSRNELANQFNTIQSAIASAERLFEVMDEGPEPSDPPVP